MVVASLIESSVECYVVLNSALESKSIMAPTVRASVILACRNGGNTIATQLEALARQEWREPWELIVSDNGSSDNSREVVEQFRGRMPHLRIVDSSEKRGAAYARNVAIKAATSDRFIFCDTDDEVAPGWIEAMADGLSTFDVVTSQFEDGRLNEQWVRELWNTSTQGPQPCLGYLPGAAGYGFGFTRKVYETIGPFDESQLRMSDIDYSWRVQLAGYKLQFLPHAVVHYRHRSTLARIFKQAYLDGQAEVRLYTKYAARGMPWPHWWVGVRSWANIIKRLPQLAMKSKRARWVVDAAFALGHARGSIRHNVLAL